MPKDNGIPVAWEALGRSIRANAIKAGYDSVSALAAEIGINCETLARYFKDPRTMKLGKLASLCKAVGVSMEDLTVALYSKEE